jgi:hypothetical protein
MVGRARDESQGMDVYLNAGHGVMSFNPASCWPIFDRSHHHNRGDKVNTTEQTPKTPTTTPAAVGALAALPMRPTYRSGALASKLFKRTAQSAGLRPGTRRGSQVESPC